MPRWKLSPEPGRPQAPLATTTTTHSACWTVLHFCGPGMTSIALFARDRIRAQQSQRVAQRLLDSCGDEIQRYQDYAAELEKANGMVQDAERKIEGAEHEKAELLTSQAVTPAADLAAALHAVEKRLLAAKGEYSTASAVRMGINDLMTPLAETLTKAAIEIERRVKAELLTEAKVNRDAVAADIAERLSDAVGALVESEEIIRFTCAGINVGKETAAALLSGKTEFQAQPLGAPLSAPNSIPQTVPELVPSFAGVDDEL